MDYDLWLLSMSGGPLDPRAPNDDETEEDEETRLERSRDAAYDAYLDNLRD